MSKYLIGIDLGTTNMKGMLVREDGKILAQASRGNTLLTPGISCAEQSAHQWWENACSILNEITAKAGPDICGQIAALCISSQAVTLLPLDVQGNPLRNAMIWMDTRAARQQEAICDAIGSEAYIRLTGARSDATFLPGKILWFRQNEPELFARTRHLVQASSYLNYRLTGEITMDDTQAAMSQCLDRRTGRWSGQIAEMTGADLDRLLPKPVPSDQMIGTVTKEAARQTGLVPGIPVLAGSSDCQASLYASGISRLGEAAESCGTSSMVFLGSEAQSTLDQPVTTKRCRIPGLPYVYDAPITATGASVNRSLELFGDSLRQKAQSSGENVYDILNKEAAESPAGSRGLLYFPHLQGERAPGWKAYAKGMFIGMTMNTSKKDILRSVFEGTAYELRYVLESITDCGPAAESLRITGGGAKSRLWSEIKASVLGMLVFLSDPQTGEAPFGDVLAAGAAAGVFPDLGSCIRELIPVKEVIEPKTSWTKIYEAYYPVYKSIFLHLDEDLDELDRIAGR